MKAYADAVINAFHVLLARSSQVFDYLTLVDGDDLFRLTHGGFIQTALLFENAVCRLPQLFSSVVSGTTINVGPKKLPLLF